jgi:hypothetical protein
MTAVPLRERFWDKVAVGSLDDCWLWQASTRNGYGSICLGGTNNNGYAHRVVVEWAHGPIPAALEVGHACDVRYAPGDFTYRRCCNPLHLYLCTRAENLAHMVACGRSTAGIPRPWQQKPLVPCPVCGLLFKPRRARGKDTMTCSFSCSNRLRPRGVALS